MRLAKKLFTLLAVGILTGAAVAVAVVYFNSSMSIKKFYHGRLIKLQNEINDITPLIQPNSDTVNAVDEYMSQMDKIDNTCSDLMDKTSELQASGKMGSYQAAEEQVNKLCQDLRPVAKYAQAIYQSSRDYLTLDKSFLTNPQAAGFNDKVQASLEIITKTKETLKTIDYPQVKDPAQPELIKLVEGDQKLATDLAAAGTSSEAAALAGQLSKSLGQNSTNFLNARIYYWDNTVGIGQLKQALLGLVGLFN